MLRFAFALRSVLCAHHQIQGTLRRVRLLLQEETLCKGQRIIKRGGGEEQECVRGHLRKVVQHSDGRAHPRGELLGLSASGRVFAGGDHRSVPAVGSVRGGQEALPRVAPQCPFRLQHADLHRHPGDLPRLQEGQLPRPEQAAALAHDAGRRLRSAHPLHHLQRRRPGPRHLQQEIRQVQRGGVPERGGGNCQRARQGDDEHVADHEPSDRHQAVGPVAGAAGEDRGPEQQRRTGQNQIEVKSRFYGGPQINST